MNYAPPDSCFDKIRRQPLFEVRSDQEKSIENSHHKNWGKNNDNITIIIILFLFLQK